MSERRDNGRQRRETRIKEWETLERVTNRTEEIGRQSLGIEVVIDQPLLDNGRRGFKRVGTKLSMGDRFLRLNTKALVALLGLRDRVRVEFGDMRTRDLSQADVVFTYLLQRTNDRLHAKLQRELKPGARVISHEFTYPGWEEVARDDDLHLHCYVVGKKQPACAVSPPTRVTAKSA